MDDKTLEIIVKLRDEAKTALAALDDQIDKTGKSTDDASDKAESFGKRLDKIARGIAPVALTVGAAGIAILGGIGMAVNASADYEQSLSVFQSASGATAQQMVAVSEKAKQLGNDITLPGVSAKDAALAMDELVKSGLNVNDTMAASKGVLSLAKAGQLDTAEAATITANALNAFNLQGKDASRVADLLAAAANASSADVGDMAYALQMSSASAAAVKVPVQDLTTAIAEMANNGIKGSDAGTSLKTMLANLTPTTKAQKDAMKELNLHFYDAQGHFVGLREMARQLEDGTKGLTDEQKQQAIQTIFGSDAMRAANIMTKEGVEGFDKLKTAVTKQGAATDLAAAQNSGLKGKLDNLKSTLDTTQITLGQALTPTISAVTQAITPVISAVGAWIAANPQLATAITIAIVGVTALAAVIGTLGLVMLGITPILAVVGGSAALIFVGIAAAAAAAVAFLIVYWTPVSQFFQGLWATVQSAFDSAMSFIGDKISWFKNNWADAIGYILSIFLLLPIKLPVYAGDAIIAVVNALMHVNWDAVFAGIWKGAVAAFDAVKDAGSRALNWLTGLDWGKIFSNAGKGIGNSVIGLIEGAINGALAGIPGKPHVNIPRFETGVRNFQGGLAVVGDVNGQGGELVSLPRGSDVYTNRESRQILDSMNGGSSTGSPAAGKQITIYQTNNNYSEYDQKAANLELGWQLAHA